MQLFWERIVGASLLEAAAFEDVEADPRSIPQAIAIVLLVSVAAGLGSIGQLGSGLGGVVTGTLAGLAAWVAWAVLTTVIGTRVLPEPQTKADFGQLLRVLAFAASPGLIQVAGVVPGLRTPVFAVASIWMLASTTVAVRQALDYRSTARAVGVCLLAWLLVLGMTIGLGLVFELRVS